MNKFLVIVIFGIIFFGYKRIYLKKSKNIKLNKFKNKLQSTQTNIERIFSYGIFKKEILTTKSNLGVDIKIKIR